LKTRTKIIMMAMLGFVLLVAGFLSFFVIDRPLPDDSLLKVPVEEVPEEENGFFLLKEIVDSIEDKIELPEEQDPTKWKPTEVEALAEKYAVQLKMLDELAGKEYIKYRPVEDLLTFDEDRNFINVGAFKRLTTIALSIAWKDFNENGSSSSLERVCSIAEIGNKMTMVESNVLIVCIGQYIQSTSLYVLDRMIIESGPGGPYLAYWISRLIGINDDYMGTRWAISASYHETKDTLSQIPSIEGSGAINISMVKKNRSSSFVADYHSFYVAMLDGPYCVEDKNVALDPGWMRFIEEILVGNGAFHMLLSQIYVDL